MYRLDELARARIIQSLLKVVTLDTTVETLEQTVTEIERILLDVNILKQKKNREEVTKET